MPRQSLAEYFVRLEANGRGPAYAHHRSLRWERWSYSEIVSTARQFARELEARSIGKGDRVMIWGANCAEWIAAFWGCVIRGVVVVPMDHIATRDFADRVFRQTNAKLLVCSHEHRFGTQSELVLEDLGTTLASQSDAPLSPVPLSREDLLQIVFTSGTTQEPKGVAISHGNVLANLEPLESEIDKYRKYERWFHPLRFMNLLPLSHVFGQFLGIFVPPILGPTTFFVDSLNPGEIIKTIKRERISVLISVPRMLQSLKDKIERDLETEGKLADFQKLYDSAAGQPMWKRWWRFRDIHSRFGWKFWAFISGGAALDKETEDFWGRVALAVIQGYGLTETTSIISINHPFRVGKGSIGKVLPGREIKLSPTGEILVRGGNIAAGYVQGNELKPVLGDEGWFHTGDMGELDEQGNLYFKGRSKNVIVTPAGMKVYPEDLEAALLRQPEIKHAVALGLKRDGNAEPVAALIPRHTAADVAAAVKRANESLADFQRIQQFVIWPDDDFPRTSTQKPRTQAIADYVHAQLLGGQAPASGATSELADIVARITKRNVGTLHPDQSLDGDLSLSSLDRVELMAALEDRYQVDLGEVQLTQASTVADLERILRQPAANEEKLPEHRYPRWIQRWPITWLRYIPLYLLAMPAVRILARPRIHVSEKARALRGPAFIVSNHIEYVDGGLIWAALPAHFRHRLTIGMLGEMLRDIKYGKYGEIKQATWWSRIVGRSVYYLMISIFNVFPLPQRSGYMESFAFAVESAQRGYSVLVFPEGRRTTDGKLQPFRAGTGVLANALNLPIIPIRIDGLWEIKASGQRGFARKPGQINITVGDPIEFAKNTDPEVIARELHNAIAAL